ncbi:uncharacterized protein BXZ73DRAFT_74055 [Epithele typhae]|uniref:uncharacterized protein n=1 Tax=Epithele typhae TaxID=378194 RepID=UPI0020085DF4|nr:uncharacterized protein BXZ73DRAFT_74055 [Epithele typhae]KAH9942984.1 hypothetical protein BXZ73DRAFT_74055 [Epithele typhae]
MSQPPAYSPPGNNPPNPDRRPLPGGWVERYDENYHAWFYVNTYENPPRSSWEHPLGPAPPQQPSGYGPPPGPPPPSRSPYPPQGGYNQSYGQPPPQQWNQPPPGPGYYGSPPPQAGYGGGYGPPPQENRGWFGSNSPQPTTAYQQQAPPKKSGPGMGTALLAGGAGLVGGALLMDAFEDHEDHEREQAYDAGYDQGFDNGVDAGDGGDW